MEIKVELDQDQKSTIIIQITNPNDPLILYSLELSEIEYKKIMEEQKILISFEDFPNFLLDLVKLCLDENNKSYSASLYLAEIPQVTFIIEEKIKFKITEHIILKLKKANDMELKKYLSKKYLDLKYYFFDIFNKLNEENKKNDILNKKNIILNENIKKIEYNNKEYINNLISEKNNEINLLKENYIKDSKNQIELYKNEKQNILSNYEEKILELKNQLDNLKLNNRKLEEKIVKYEVDQKNFEEKYDYSNTELNQKIKENNDIILENKMYKEKCSNLENNLNELKYRNDSLEKELEESNNNNLNLNIIIDSLKKQIESNEDNINSLKNDNLNLKLKLDKTIEEIKKGNNIIEKLSNEVKNKKSKLKAIKETKDIQEEIIKQKQNILDAQNKDMDNIKNDIALKNKEIDELKNKIENYNKNLNENEKLLEENKKMILFLNKNLNDITNAPFKSRFGQNYFQNKMSTLNYGISNSNDFSNTLENEGNFEGNYNLEKDDVEKEESKYYRDIYYLNHINLINNDNEDEEMIILPETNLCNYKVSGKLGEIMNRYMTKNSDNFNDEQNSLLEHKYGNYPSNSENKNENIGKRTTYNIEEEFPIKLIKNQNYNVKQ